MTKITIPYSKESEIQVLGCMLSSLNALNIGSDSLDDSEFYFKEHKIIFNVLKTSWKQEKPSDLHLVAEELKRQGKLEAAGGIQYITLLVQSCSTSAYVEEYIKIVKDKSILRNMIFTAQEIEKKACSEPADVSLAIDEAQKAFFMIGQSNSQGCGKLLRQILDGSKSRDQKPFLKELQERQEKYALLGEKGNEVAGITTHFKDLDKMINGFANSNLMILAARPAMGKTAFAINLAENICCKSHIPVGIFSLEMSADQLVHRMICSRAEVLSDKIKNGSISGMEFQKIVIAVNELANQPIIIDDQANLTINDLRSKARRMKEQYGIGFLMIDYLQLIASSSLNRENRQVEVAEISRMLKNLARELDIPILCLSQLSRKVEERDGHRPQMSDLRESGQLEQDSDLIMFLLRHEYYNPDSFPGKAELIIAKNRHGRIGSVDLVYEKQFALFKNLEIEKESKVSPMIDE